jgi:hypothetical protein
MVLKISNQIPNYLGGTPTFVQTKKFHMKKIFSLLTALAVFVILIAGCKGSMSNAGPKEVLASFFEKLSKKDLDGAAKLATKDSKSTIDMMKKAFEAGEKMKDQTTDANAEDPAEEFKNVEIGEAKINGDAATVPVRNKKKETEFDFPLKKEDGAWKVDFSMTTLMTMGMQQKRKQEQMSGVDPTTTDVDSADIQKGIEVLDSLSKHIDPEKLEETKKALEKLKDQK